MRLAMYEVPDMAVIAVLCLIGFVAAMAATLWFVKTYE